MSAPLRVNFVLHAIGKTGGVMVVLEYARRLRRLGHDVRVYYPLVQYPVYFSASPRWKRLLLRAHGALRTLAAARGARRAAGEADVRLVPSIAGAFVRDADFTIATAWPTAYDVAALPASKGRKLYFVQGYETWNGESQKVDGSFRLPLGILTIAPWLTRLVRERFGIDPKAEVRNGVDLDLFVPPPSRPAAPITILMMYHVQAVKGVPDGLDVLRRIHEQHPGVRIRTFGMFPFSDAPAYVEHFRDPSPEALVRLYQEAHVFLHPSLSDGWGLPVVEALACGCAVVATRTGCVPLLEGSESLRVSEPGDRESLFRNVRLLVQDRDLLERAAKAAREAVIEFGWEMRGEAFERVLFDSTGG